MAKTLTPDIASLVRYQREQFDRFESNLHQAIATGDADAVHDLRVASRRLHDTLEVMAAWGGRKRVRRVQRALRRIRRAFRKVRDLDVLRLSLSEAAGPDVTDAAAQADVEAILTHRRERAFATASRIGRQPKLVRQATAIDDIREAFCRLAEPDSILLSEQLREMLRQRATALLQDDPREETTDLHAARIRVKQMRYCVQLLQECGCLEAGDLMEALTRMQELLGHWCDEVVATRVLSRLAGRWDIVSLQTALSGKLLACASRRAEAASEYRQKALAAWPALAAMVTDAVPDAAACGAASGDEESGPAAADGE